MNIDFNVNTTQVVKGIVLKVLEPEVKNQQIYQKFIIQQDGDYGKEICFQTFGRNVEKTSFLKRGQHVTVFYNLDSRENNGKWYTNANAWKWIVNN